MSEAPKLNTVPNIGWPTEFSRRAPFLYILRLESGEKVTGYVDEESAGAYEIWVNRQRLESPKLTAFPTMPLRWKRLDTHEIITEAVIEWKEAPNQELVYNPKYPQLSEEQMEVWRTGATDGVKAQDVIDKL